MRTGVGFYKDINIYTSLWIHIPSEKVIGDYLCRLGGSNCLLKRYVDP